MSSANVNAASFLPVEQQEKVATFNEITHNTSIAEAVALLAAANWDLGTAITSYLNGRSGQMAGAGAADEDDEMEMEDGDDESENEIEEDDEEEDEDGDASFLNGNQEDGEIEIDDFEAEIPMAQEVSLFPSPLTTIPEALAAFQRNFRARYPTATSLDFFQSTIPEAIEECFSRAFKPLVFYVHHEKSGSANIFPMSLMNDELAFGMLREKYVVYPWDITERSNLEILKMTLEAARLSCVTQLITRYQSDPKNFPLLITLTKKRSQFQAGTIRPQQAIGSVRGGLDSCYESYQLIRKTEEKEEKERKERQRIRDQQDEEYQASLRVDMERKEKKKREEEEIQREEAERLRAEDAEAARKAAVSATLPEEPLPSESDVIHVKFRLPGNSQTMRRFRRREKIQILADFLSSEGYPADKFKFFNSEFPKRNILEKFDFDSSFGDVNWPLREQIFVEEI